MTPTPNPAPSPLPEGQARAIAERVMREHMGADYESIHVNWHSAKMLVQAGYVSCHAAALSDRLARREQAEAWVTIHRALCRVAQAELDAHRNKGMTGIQIAVAALNDLASRAVSPEVRERERREGAREALESLEKWFDGAQGRDPKYMMISWLSKDVRTFRDREYPLPAALTPPSVTPTCETCGGELAVEAIARGEHRHPNESLCLRSLASQVAALAAQVRGAK